MPSLRKDSKYFDLMMAIGMVPSSDNWYNITTGVITCDAIIPNDEVIQCL